MTADPDLLNMSVFIGIVHSVMNAIHYLFLTMRYYSA